jgi:uncharacterized protein YerC
VRRATMTELHKLWCAILGLDQSTCCCYAFLRGLCLLSSAVSVRSRRVALLHEMPSPSSDWTARQPHARGWLG